MKTGLARAYPQTYPSEIVDNTIVTWACAPTAVCCSRFSASSSVLKCRPFGDRIFVKFFAQNFNRLVVHLADPRRTYAK